MNRAGATSVACDKVFSSPKYGRGRVIWVCLRALSLNEELQVDAIIQVDESERPFLRTVRYDIAEVSKKDRVTRNDDRKVGFA